MRAGSVERFIRIGVSPNQLPPNPCRAVPFVCLWGGGGPKGVAILLSTHENIIRVTIL